MNLPSSIIFLISAMVIRFSCTAYSSRFCNNKLSKQNNYRRHRSNDEMLQFHRKNT
eukprot:UN19772